MINSLRVITNRDITHVTAEYRRALKPVLPIHNGNVNKTDVMSMAFITDVPEKCSNTFSTPINYEWALTIMTYSQGIKENVRIMTY